MNSEANLWEEASEDVMHSHSSCCRGFDAYNEDDELMVAALEDYEVQQALLNMP